MDFSPCLGFFASLLSDILMMVSGSAKCFFPKCGRRCVSWKQKCFLEEEVFQGNRCGSWKQKRSLEEERS